MSTNRIGRCNSRCIDYCISWARLDSCINVHKITSTLLIIIPLSPFAITIMYYILIWVRITVLLRHPQHWKFSCSILNIWIIWSALLWWLKVVNCTWGVIWDTYRNKFWSNYPMDEISHSNKKFIKSHFIKLDAPFLGIIILASIHICS